MDKNDFSHRNKKKLPLRVRMADILDLPAEVLQKQNVSLIGCHTGIVSGCRSIVNYEEDRVALRTVEGQVIFHGEKLEICSLVEDRVTVEGRIHTVQILRKGETET